MTTTPPPVETMLARLIAEPSVSCVNPEWDQGNDGVAVLLAEWLEGLGFTVAIQPVTVSPKKVNLIATLGSGEAGLVLAGHTDTVPYDPARWSYDPFRLTEVDGRYYGLGTSDMKGFFALAVEAARGWRAKDLRQPLTLIATADEETSMDGARLLAEAGRAPGRYAVIGEPTGLRPMRMHKGILMEALHVLGRSGHSSDPALGLNAIEGMHRAIDAILDWRTELQHRHSHPGFAVSVPTLNLGRVVGGDNPNRICPECELQFDLRFLPGMDMAQLRAEIHRRIGAVLDDSGYTIRWRSLFPGAPALETPADSAIVQAVEELTGATAGAVSFGTEGPFFAQLGVETVIFGPGDIECAHQPDEFLRQERIAPAIALLRALIQRFCIAPD